MASARLRVPPKEPEARKGRRLEDEASGSGSEEAGSPALLSFDEMPHWFQDENHEWILHGHRPISHSVRTSLRSWWRLHNETVDIYYHPIPPVAFLLCELYMLQYLNREDSKVTSANSVAFSCFMLAATVCTIHFGSLSHFDGSLLYRGPFLPPTRYGWYGDLIIGDIVLGVYIIFWCDSTLRIIYWSIVSH